MYSLFMLYFITDTFHKPLILILLNVLFSLRLLIVKDMKSFIQE